MSKLSNLTVKGQVTIPKNVRDALGLKPGEPVEFDWRGGTEAVIRKPRHDAVKRRAEIAGQIDAAAAKYAHLRTGRSTEDIMRDIRGDDPFPP
jgi:AbrB family looped-hinge helix DNA binding protein